MADLATSGPAVTPIKRVGVSNRSARKDSPGRSDRFGNSPGKGRAPTRFESRCPDCRIAQTAQNGDLSAGFELFSRSKNNWFFDRTVLRCVGPAQSNLRREVCSTSFSSHYVRMRGSKKISSSARRRFSKYPGAVFTCSGGDRAVQRFKLEDYLPCDPMPCQFSEFCSCASLPQRPHTLLMMLTAWRCSAAK